MDKIDIAELEVLVGNAEADDMVLLAKKNGAVGMTAVKNLGVGEGDDPGSSVTISATAPLNPTEGDVWIDDLIRYTYTNNKWIEI